MKKVILASVLAFSAVAIPAVAASSYDGLPPGCFLVTPYGPIICVDMPME